MRDIAILGASGGVGRPLAQRALQAGHRVRAQSRSAGKIADLGADIHEGAPDDPDLLRKLVDGTDAVVFALGAPPGRTTTLFSDVTAALLDAMEQRGARRLIAITGVGAGETRGHGGFVYDRIIFPLFTRPLYADKNRQEEDMIGRSNTDWTIVRPAPFKSNAPDEPLEIHTRVGQDIVLRRITRDEVARLVLTLIEQDSHHRERLFIGHP